MQDARTRMWLSSVLWMTASVQCFLAPTIRSVIPNGKAVNNICAPAEIAQFSILAAREPQQTSPKGAIQRTSLQRSSTSSLVMSVAGGVSNFGLWDAHCHVHLSRQFEEIESLQEDVTLSLMGTRSADWKDISRLSSSHPTRIVPSFGLHPWWAHEDHGDWEEELLALLEASPQACVGEIGLDKQWVPPGWEEVQYEAQMAMFRKQLDLATRLQRPVSLHCVAAYGDMFDTLRHAAALPPALYLHSFGGKAGMLNSFVKMKKYGDRFYFGFSAAVNLRSPKTPDVIKQVPDERLLLESDLEAPSQVRESLWQMLGVIAEAKGWSLEQAAAVTTSNARAYLDLTARTPLAR